MAESTPGDYYERQRDKAIAIQEEIYAMEELLRLCHCEACVDLRAKIRDAKHKLELVRYTGD